MAFDDKDDPRNGAKYQTGKPCVEKGCENPAGTAWSPLWCFEHNVERLGKLTEAFELIKGEDGIYNPKEQTK